LKRLFSKKFHSHQDIEGIVSSALLKCWENIGKGLRKNSTISDMNEIQLVYWMSKDDFYHFLDEFHHGLEIPEASYLSHYQNLVQHLINHNFALELFNNNHAHVEIQFKKHGDEEVIYRWSSPEPEIISQKEIQFRFPCYQPLYNLVSQHLKWVSSHNFFEKDWISSNSELKSQLDNIIKELEKDSLSQLTFFISNPTSEHKWDSFVWQIEELLLTQGLCNRTLNNQALIEYAFLEPIQISNQSMKQLSKNEIELSDSLYDVICLLHK